MKKLILIFMCVFLFSLVSASYNIDISNYPLNITTTKGEVYNFNLTIKNIDTENITRIKVVSNLSSISMNEISLGSGENKSVEISLISDKTNNYIITFVGYVNYTFTSPTNNNYYINITNDGKINPKILDVNIGDNVYIKNIGTNNQFVWVNSVFYNLALQQEIIFSNLSFDLSIYTLSDFGGKVNVGTSGMSEVLRKDINIYVNTIIPQTSLIIDYISFTEATINFPNSKTGNLILKNTGSKVAEITLSGEWFSFNPKIITSLAPDSTVSVSYTIKPLLTNSEQTNQNYTKTIKVMGNFETIEKNINIYVPYANIGDVTNISSLDYLKYLKEVYCASDSSTKTSILCVQTPIVIYEYITNISDLNFTTEMTMGLLQKLYNSIFGTQDIITTSTNLLKGDISNITEKQNNMSNDINFIKEDLNKNKSILDNIVFGIIVGGITIFSLGIAGLLFFMIKKYRYKKLTEGMRRW